MNRFKEIQDIIIKNELVKFFFEYYNYDKEAYLYIFNKEGDFEFEDTDQVLIYLEKFLNLSNFEVVESTCNSDTMYCVVYFKDDNIYVKLKGEYDSYGNYDHDYFNDKNHIIEVKPKKIEVIIYE